MTEREEVAYVGLIERLAGVSHPPTTPAAAPAAIPRNRNRRLILLQCVFPYLSLSNSTFLAERVHRSANRRGAIRCRANIDRAHRAGHHRDVTRGGGPAHL